MGTHAEKEYLQLASPWYDEILLNANLVEATAGATSAFLLALRKPFTIDPVTYAFGQATHYLVNPRRGAVKRTFTSLADTYGTTVANRLQAGNPLSPADFSTDANVDAFCGNVLRYQQERLADALTTNQAFLDADLAAFPPTRLVAPYFYNDPRLGWLTVNRVLAEACSNRLPAEQPLWIVVSFDGLLLDQREEIDRIVESYRGLNCTGYLLWPSDFDESKATVGQIVGLRRLSRGLCEDGRSALMFYGGYFSALLKDEGVTGIFHGVGYGEKRDIVPVVGGGLPPAKYYFRPIHDDVYIDEALRVIDSLDEASFLEVVCDCTICRGLVSRGSVNGFRDEFGAREERAYGRGMRELPTARVYRLSKFHYIESKYRELREVERASREELVGGLRDAFSRFEPFFGYARVSHLLRWYEALTHELAS